MYTIIGVITGVWVTSFVAGLFNEKYQAPEQVNFIFSSIVGALFVNAARNKDR